MKKEYAMICPIELQFMEMGCVHAGNAFYLASVMLFLFCIGVFESFFFWRLVISSPWINRRLVYYSLIVMEMGFSIYLDFGFEIRHFQGNAIFL
jgi:hypothetical protein